MDTNFMKEWLILFLKENILRSFLIVQQHFLKLNISWVGFATYYVKHIKLSITRSQPRNFFKTMEIKKHKRKITVEMCKVQIHGPWWICFLIFSIEKKLIWSPFFLICLAILIIENDNAISCINITLNIIIFFLQQLFLIEFVSHRFSFFLLMFAHCHLHRHLHSFPLDQCRSRVYRLYV